jgi:hypothetical protein
MPLQNYVSLKEDFMRRLSVLIVLFVGFSVMNGYGGGGKEPKNPAPGNPAQATVQGVGDLTNNIGVLTNNISDLTKNVDNLTKNVGDLTERVGALEKGKTPPGPGQDPVSVGEPRFIPINLAIINKHKENLGELDYFLSKDINLTISDLEKNSIIVEDRILKERIDKPRSEDKLEISKNDPGKYWNFPETPTGRESMEIFFSDKSAILTFTRNRNKDVFELTSARKDGKEIDLDDETVQLYIKYKGSRIALTAEKTEAGNEWQERPATTARRDRPPAIPQKILLSGQGYLTQAAVVDYMQKHSRASHNISALVSAYFKIAKEEGVNHEIAIAQMWHATRALSHNALLKNNNYAGLVKSKTFDGTFRNSDMGVRAHIQHLKGYASSAPLNKARVDPRYQILVTNGYLGKGDTLEKLSAYWSQSKEYESNIVRILEDLYQHQYQYNSRL